MVNNIDVLQVKRIIYCETIVVELKNVDVQTMNNTTKMINTKQITKQITPSPKINNTSDTSFTGEKISKLCLNIYLFVLVTASD